MRWLVLRLCGWRRTERGWMHWRASDVYGYTTEQAWRINGLCVPEEAADAGGEGE